MSCCANSGTLATLAYLDESGIVLWSCRGFLLGFLSLLQIASFRLPPSDLHDLSAHANGGTDSMAILQEKFQLQLLPFDDHI